MMRKILFILLWMFGWSAMAQVSLDDCQKWARENYPEVKRYNIIDATEACNLSNASKNWLPMVTIGIKGGWDNNTIDINDLTLNAKNNGDYYKGLFNDMTNDLDLKMTPQLQYRAGVEVMQPIYDGGATSLQREMVRKQSETERAKIEVSLHSLEERVLEVYFSILLLEDRKQQIALRKELLDKNWQKLCHLEKEGLAKMIDVEAIELEQLKLKQNSDIMDENLAIYRSTLSLLTGHNITTEKLAFPPMPTIERPAFSQMPEIKFLDTQSELLSLKSRNEHVKTMPKFGFVGQFNFGFPNGNLFRDMVNQNPRLNIALGLQLTWDISSLYTRKNNLSLIRYEQENIQNQREVLFFNQRIKNTSLETRMKRLESIRLQDDKIVELYRKLRIAEEVKVDNHVVDVTELLSKINNEADAKLQRSIHETEIMRDMYRLIINGDTEK